MMQWLKEHFIPCVDNGFKPNALERFSAGSMLVLVVLSFAIANMQSLLWMGSNWMVGTVLPAVIVDLTNTERGREDEVPLKRNTLLDRAAQLKADDMAKNGYFAHYSPSGVSPWFWFDQVSYNYVHAGENLAVHFTDSNDVVDAWMKSPLHKANILNGQYAEIGVGTAKGEYKGVQTVFVVQLFGTQARTGLQTDVDVTSEPLPVTQQISLETVSQEDVVEGGTEAVAPATLETVEIAIPKEVIAESNVQPVDFVPVVVDEVEDPVVAFSDLATTTRAGIPAVIETDTPSAPDRVDFIEKAATMPSIWLQIVYGLLASVVVIALILSIIIEWRRQHPLQIAYATGLLATMAGLFYLHTILTSGVTIV